MDTLTPRERSARMGLVRSSDTALEMVIRRLIHGMGYRYRLHVSTLPGKPDMVFPSRGKIVFIHGCFWHQHASSTCKLARMPKSRLAFWQPKLERNRKRDVNVRRRLKHAGWRVLVIWECQIKMAYLADRIKRFLEED
jgi:DNA mismatch endonuclease (patch repair protein)